MATRFRVVPDAAICAASDRAAMEIFWTVVTTGLVVAIVGIVLWAFVIAPFRVPRHSGH